MYSLVCYLCVGGVVGSGGVVRVSLGSVGEYWSIVCGCNWTIVCESKCVFLFVFVGLRVAGPFIYTF